MRLWWPFRSPYVLCFSIATEPVNVPGWLIATTLATRAPGHENRLIDFQPAPVIAVTVLFSLRGVIAVRRNMTGDSSAHRERAKRLQRQQTFYRRSKIVATGHRFGETQHRVTFTVSVAKHAQ